MSSNEAKTAIANGQPIPELLFTQVYQNLDADLYANADLPPTLAADRITDTPADRFTEQIFYQTCVTLARNGLILFYHARSGEGAVLKWKPDGSLEKLQYYKTFSRNWTSIISAQENLMVYYNYCTGEAAIQRLNSDGTLSTISDRVKWGIGWTHIIVTQDGKICFFYMPVEDKYCMNCGALIDAKAEKCGCGRTQPLFKFMVKTINSNGELGSFIDVIEKNIGLNFTDVVEAHHGLLLFYDNRTGGYRAMSLRRDGGDLGIYFIEKSRGSLPYKDYHDYSHIIVSPMGNLIMFYNRSKMKSLITRMKSSGELEFLNICDSGNWTHIIPGPDGLILYYRDSTGEGMIQRLNEDGSLEDVGGYLNPDLPYDYIWKGQIIFNTWFYGGQSHEFVFNPDRRNPMSYWYGPERERFTPDQIHTMRKALRHENLRHLVRPFEFLIRYTPKIKGLWKMSFDTPERFDLKIDQDDKPNTFAFTGSMTRTDIQEQYVDIIEGYVGSDLTVEFTRKRPNVFKQSYKGKISNVNWPDVVMFGTYDQNGQGKYHWMAKLSL